MPAATVLDLDRSQMEHYLEALTTSMSRTVWQKISLLPHRLNRRRTPADTVLP